MTPIPSNCSNAELSAAVKLEVWFFGCIGEPGHYLHRPDGRIEWTRVHPWGSKIDGGLCGGNKYNIPDGVTYEHHKDGWTAVALWDRSGDSRPASNSVFLVWANASTAEILSAARQQWPQVFTRPKFPVIAHNIPVEDAAGKGTQ